MDRVAVIIVNYQNPDDTIECIHSVMLSEQEMYSLDVVVVDNGSEDDSVETIKIEIKENPSIHLLECKENLGFSAGNNVGIKYALESLEVDYVLLLNDDTIVEDNAISLLHSRAEPNTVVVPKIMYYADKNVIWYAGGYIDRKRGRAEHIGINRRNCTQFSKELSISFASGCCMMVHKEILNKVGLLDESYFLYWEDADFSERLIEKNINIIYIPDAIIYHKVSASTGRLSKIVVYYGYRNQFYFLNKYHFGISAYLYTYLNCIYCFAKGLLFNTNQKLIPRAWWDYKKGIRGKIQL